jgi:hypothetical protein
VRNQGFIGGCLAAAVLAATLSQSEAAISYSVMDSIITENFDTLPTDLPQNANIQTVYAQGWKDNSTTVAGATIGLPGWYLYHPTDPSGDEDGFNHHQRVRSGPGTSGTGAFYLFGTSSSDPEKALGTVGANTLAPNGQNMYMAMRLVNHTGQNLTGFTITYDGEQWRSAGLASAESITFGYSLSANEMNWFEDATVFENVATAGYTGALYGSAQAIDGNTTGRFPDITSSITGINWVPGAELWLRWTDQQVPTTDDGMAIDNVRFKASNTIVNPNDIFSVTSGLASNPTTWSNNQAPDSGK